MMKRKELMTVLFLVCISLLINGCASDKEAKRKAQIQALQEKFTWWPTDAKPSPVKDDRGGYWWWPAEPGQVKPWGNRGYVYVYKIIFDYKADDLPAAQPRELRPSLLVKKIIRNLRILFDFDKSALRDDAIPILDDAVKALNRNPDAAILITGNADIRGSENYNLKLGKKRAEVVQNYMIESGISQDRIKIVSRGKLDAVAPLSDLVGMQKDRNAQFMVAVVEEVMLPTPESGEAPAEVTAAIPPDAKLEEGKYVVEREETVEGEVKVSTREYVIQKGDSLWKIAAKELGSGHRWKYLYEVNKDRIKDPNRLKAGTRIIIPVE